MQYHFLSIRLSLLLYLDHTFVRTFSLTSPPCMHFTGNYFVREYTASANRSGANYIITHRSSSPEALGTLLSTHLIYYNYTDNIDYVCTNPTRGVWLTLSPCLRELRGDYRAGVMSCESGRKRRHAPPSGAPLTGQFHPLLTSFFL